MIRQDRVNRPARGLLDLFRAKVGGKGPDTFSQLIQPTIDQAAFLQAADMKATRVATTTTTTTSIALAVPQSETWIIHNVLALYQNDATASAATSWAIGYLSVINLLNGVGTATNIEIDTWSWQGGDGGAGNSGNIASARFQPGGTFIMPPGAAFRNTIDATSGATTRRLVLTVWYTPLLV